MNAKELVKTWFANVDNGNFNAQKELMTTGHKFHNPMTPAPVGPEEHIGMQQMMTAAFEGNHHLDFFVEEGNRIVVRGHWSGKHTGEFQGVPATGNNVQFTFTDIYEIENGKIAKEYLEMNPMAIMMQIGAMQES